MASVLKVDELKGNSTAGIIAVTGEGNSTTTNLQQGLAKAWLSLDGTATFDSSDTEIRDSFNVDSTVDNGSGDYTLSYTSNMNDANYSAVCFAGVKNVLTAQERLHTISASSYRVEMNEDNSSVGDSSHVMVVIHGDLA